MRRGRPPTRPGRLGLFPAVPSGAAILPPVAPCRAGGSISIRGESRVRCRPGAVPPPVRTPNCWSAREERSYPVKALFRGFNRCLLMDRTIYTYLNL